MPRKAKVKKTRNTGLWSCLKSGPLGGVIIAALLQHCPLGSLIPNGTDDVTCRWENEVLNLISGSTPLLGVTAEFKLLGF